MTHYDRLDVHVPVLPPTPTRATLKHRFNVLDRPDQHVSHPTARSRSKEVKPVSPSPAALPNKNVGLAMRTTPIRLQTKNWFNPCVGSGRMLLSHRLLSLLSLNKIPQEGGALPVR